MQGRFELFFSIRSLPQTPCPGLNHKTSQHPRPQHPLFGALCDNGAGGGGLVLPRGRQDADGLVVAGETVDTGLDENEAELGVLVLSVALEVLADGHGLVIEALATDIQSLHVGDVPLILFKTHLLDQHVQVLRKLGGKACEYLSVSRDRTEALWRKRPRPHLVWDICRSIVIESLRGLYRWTSGCAECGYLYQTTKVSKSAPQLRSPAASILPRG
jgi:hypothetical protein